METMYDVFKAKAAGETPITPQTIKENNLPPVIEQQKQPEITPSSTEKPGENKETPPAFDVKGFNTYFQTSFENEDSIKNLFELTEKYKDLEQQFTTSSEQLKTTQDKYNSLLDNFDPEKILPNKEMVALSQLASKYPNVDPGILSFVRKTDLTGLNKLDALILIDKLSVPTATSDIVREAEILRSLGIDETDRSQLTENDIYRIEREYHKQSNLLNEIKGFQPEISTFDFEAERKQRQDKIELDNKNLSSHNEKALKIVLDSYKETKSSYKDGDKETAYSFVVNEDFKKDVFNDVLSQLNYAGIKLTEENANEIAREIDNMYWIRNRHAILNDTIKQAISQLKEQTNKEIHSDSPKNTIEAPIASSEQPKTLMESARAGLFKNKI